MTENQQLAVITGGAGEIGRQIALQYAKINFHVLIVDLNDQFISDTEALFAKSNVKNYDILKVDITDKSLLTEKMMPFLTEKGYSLSVLILAAAINKIEKFSSETTDNFERILRVNTIGCVIPTAVCWGALKKNHGSVIALSSVAGYAPLFGRTSYCASKYALHGFFDALRTESTGEVHIMIACPTFVDTSFSKKDTSKISEMLTPEGVALKLIEGWQKKKELLFIGKTSKIAYWAYKLFPRFYLQKMLEQNKF